MDFVRVPFGLVLPLQQIDFLETYSREIRLYDTQTHSSKQEKEGLCYAQVSTSGTEDAEETQKCELGIGKAWKSCWENCVEDKLL